MVCAALAYSWYKQKTARSSMVFIRPEFQPHTFISNSGKLYFSELAPSDDDLYYCIVSLTTIGGAGNYVGASRDESRVSIPFRLSVTTGGERGVGWDLALAGGREGGRGNP